MRTRELVAAGVHTGALVEAYTCCGQYLSRSNSAAYPAARALLYPSIRPYYDAILAFCGYADELLDDQTTPVREREVAYDAWTSAFFDGSYESDPAGALPPGGPQGRLISRAFRHVVDTYGIDLDTVREFLHTMRGDLHVTSYATYADLNRYMSGISGVHAGWMNALLETRHDDAQRIASSLGYGVYLLDFLADLREDLELGRVYIPAEDLDMFGLDRAAFEQIVSRGVMTPPFRELIHFETVRAGQYFDTADTWWRHVHPSSRELPRQYLALARLSLRQLVRSDYDVFRSRPRGRLLGATRARTSTGVSYLRARRDHRRHARGSAAAGT
ncbi:phytoene/squalene synthase family protein [Streptomyces phytophilus]|uniref:phytoene/squalene synthase family protein n=1 Tax=Streptomyces phytophilus TaxID=722715 RepID=UPI0015F11AEB|nr:squalene/phytoene synthase family protein [Streptomyces phytophilus]